MFEIALNLISSQDCLPFIGIASFVVTTCLYKLFLPSNVQSAPGACSTFSVDLSSSDSVQSELDEKPVEKLVEEPILPVENISNVNFEINNIQYSFSEEEFLQLVIYIRAIATCPEVDFPMYLYLHVFSGPFSLLMSNVYLIELEVFWIVMQNNIFREISLPYFTLVLVGYNVYKLYKRYKIYKQFYSISI